MIGLGRRSPPRGISAKKSQKTFEKSNLFVNKKSKQIMEHHDVSKDSYRKGWPPFWVGWRFSQPFDEIAKVKSHKNNSENPCQKSVNSDQKSHPNTGKSLEFQQKSRLLWCVDDMWTKCGRSVVEVWSLKVWESAEKVDLRGSEEARGARAPGPQGARARAPPRTPANRLFRHFPRLLTTTLRPHFDHTPVY